MNLTLRQLLPRLSGLIHVVQPKVGEPSNVTVLWSDSDVDKYFSDDELDNDVSFVECNVNRLRVVMKEENNGLK